MFKTIIRLDEERMKRDGIDVEEKKMELQELIDEIGGMKFENGILTTSDSGLRSYLFMELEEKEWFMKYVSEWIIDDPHVYDDAIKSLNEIGVKCCYD